MRCIQALSYFCFRQHISCFTVGCFSPPTATSVCCHCLQSSSLSSVSVLTLHHFGGGLAPSCKMKSQAMDKYKGVDGCTCVPSGEAMLYRKILIKLNDTEGVVRRNYRNKGPSGLWHMDGFWQTEDVRHCHQWLHWVHGGLHKTVPSGSCTKRPSCFQHGHFLCLWQYTDAPAILPERAIAEVK